MPARRQTRSANRTPSRAPVPEAPAPGVWQTRPDARTHRPPARERRAGCRARGRPDPDLDFGPQSNLFGKAALLGIGRRSVKSRDHASEESLNKRQIAAALFVEALA